MTGPDVPPPSSLSRRIRLGAGVLGMVALTAMVAAGPGLLTFRGQATPSADSEAFVATGYNLIVDDIFVPRKWLIARSSRPKEGRAPDPIVRLSPTAPVADLQTFLVNSPLDADLAADNPALWRFSSGLLVGIDPGAHASPSPFATGSAWRGDLAFCNDKDQPRVCQSVDAAPVLVGSGWRLSLLPHPPKGGVPSFAIVDLDAPHTRTERTADILEFRAAGTAVARVFTIGRDVVVRATGSSPVVEVGGISLIPRDGRSAYRVLAAGRTLQFVYPNSRAAPVSFRLNPDDNQLSRFQLPDTRVNLDSRRDPTAPAGLAPSFSTAMERFARARPRDSRLAAKSYATTLSPILQAKVQAALDWTCADLRNNPAIGRSTFRAGVTVMSTDSGHILAMASYPARAEQIPQEAASPMGQTLLAQNQNFIRFPIGSAAKIVFTAAILNAHPEFVDFSTFVALHAAAAKTGTGGGHSKAFRNLLGVDLGADIGEHEAGDSPAAGINLRSFVISSSDAYAAALMLVAAAPHPTDAAGEIPTGEQWYAFKDGQHRKSLPHLVFPLIRQTPDGAQVGGAAGSLSNLDWVRTMGRSFDLPLIAGVGAMPPSGGVTDLDDYDLGPWRQITDQRGERVIGPARGFVAITPEQERLGMNEVENLRDDYVSLILGGGRSLWNNVKLAEAYSRVILGRPVHATLVADAPPTGPGLVFAHDEALIPLRSAMKGVVLRSEGGTAGAVGGSAALKAVRGLAPAGEEVRIFSKTGTPSIDTVERSAANAAVNELIARGAVVYSSRGLRLDGEARATRAAMLLRLRADPRASEIMAGESVSADSVVDWVLKHQHPYEPLLIFNSGRLAGVRADLSGQRFGGVYAFVLGRYRVGAPDAQPLRAVTVVINIQHRLPGPGGKAGVNPAIVLVTRTKLLEALSPVLFPERQIQGASAV